MNPTVAHARPVRGGTINLGRLYLGVRLDLPAEWRLVRGEQFTELRLGRLHAGTI